MRGARITRLQRNMSISRKSSKVGGEKCERMSIICDRCGCQLEDSGTKIVPHYFDFITEDLTVPINKDMENRHYCIDCTMEALEFLEPKKKPEKKLEENAQKKPLDSGKVMALHNVGWDIAKIADELGVREWQVYMCIYYRENKKSLTQEENHE